MSRRTAVQLMFSLNTMLTAELPPYVPYDPRLLHRTVGRSYPGTVGYFCTTSFNSQHTTQVNSRQATQFHSEIRNNWGLQPFAPLHVTQRRLRATVSLMTLLFEPTQLAVVYQPICRTSNYRGHVTIRGAGVWGRC